MLGGGLCGSEDACAIAGNLEMRRIVAVSIWISSSEQSDAALLRIPSVAFSSSEINESVGRNGVSFSRTTNECNDNVLVFTASSYCTSILSKLAFARKVSASAAYNLVPRCVCGGSFTLHGDILSSFSVSGFRAKGDECLG